MPTQPTNNKSVWGALAMMIAFLLGQFNVAASVEEIELVLGQSVEAVQVLIGVGGFVLVLWDRWKAGEK